MYKFPFLLFGLFLICNLSVGQNPNQKVIYIIDSIPVLEDPDEDNDIDETDIADVAVIKNKDTLKMLGYEKFDGAVYVFTKEYRNRSEELKRIPSSKQMERIGDAWYFKEKLYSGPFIDYYYSGRKQGEGTFVNGKANGKRVMYYQNGKISLERIYTNGIENGIEKEYYEDGVLKQKGAFSNGRETGVWEMYFPNGQLKQRSNFVDGKMEGETTVYYSTGKILSLEITKDGKTTPDKRLEKLEEAMSKGHKSNREGDFKTAVKNYSKVIELDSMYAEAYFARGTARLNDFQFDEAIFDFDIALRLEPYSEKTLTNRAFARIRKHQFGNSRKLSGNNGVSILASKDNPRIPENDLNIICNDLRNAISLGDKSGMVIEALAQFCDKKKDQ
jgi:antitoxin component YwqK of YwqJK toxin-antitoxin module